MCFQITVWSSSNKSAIFSSAYNVFLIITFFSIQPWSGSLGTATTLSQHLHLQYPHMKTIFSGVTQRRSWKADASPGKTARAHMFIS